MTTPTPSTATAPAPVLRLTGVRGLVAAVTHMLGFEPTDSLVVACFTGPRQRLGPVARMDLPSLEHAEALKPLAACAARHAEHVAVLCYHVGARPRSLDTLLAELRRCGVPITTVVSVQGGRIRDASSPSAMRHDPGVEVAGPDDDELAALRDAGVATGRMPLASRSAVAASIAPCPGARAFAAEIDAAVDAMEAALSLRDRERGAPTTRRAVAWADAVVAAALADVAGSYPRTDDRAPRAAIATLIAACQSPPLRDVVMARLIAMDGPRSVAVLITAASLSADAYCVEPCTVLAAVAYRHGDGALAQIALDRALRVRPRHRLAGLLRAAFSSGLSPAQLDALTTADGDPVPDDAARASARHAVEEPVGRGRDGTAHRRGRARMHQSQREPLQARIPHEVGPPRDVSPTVGQLDRTATPRDGIDDDKSSREAGRARERTEPDDGGRGGAREQDIAEHVAVDELPHLADGLPPGGDREPGLRRR